MGIIATAIRELIAAGLTGEALVAAVERIEDHKKSTALSGAERTRRWREKRQRDVSDEVTNVTSHASPVTSTYIDSSSTSSDSKKLSKKERKIYIPADFELNAADLAACAELNWQSTQTAAELLRFKDHAAQNGRQCVDWHAAWRSWVRSPFQTQTKPGGMNGHHVAAKPNVSDVLRGMAEETRRREGADFGGLLPEVGRR